MSADILLLISRASLALSAAIIVVLLLRAPFRAWFGAQVAYALWLLAPIATLAAFLPARQVVVSAPVASAPSEAITAPATTTIEAPLGSADGAAHVITLDASIIALIVLGVWLTGVFFSVFLMVRSQRRFVLDSFAAGPAVVGVLRPRIVLPRDFEQRYTPAERDLVLAHERAHLVAFDAQINAVAAFVQCLNWFNPLVHAARGALRVDQELACDARVLAQHANAKRAYAEAMLKTQLVERALPLGCHWPSIGAKPLKERITMIARPRPASTRVALGAALCAMLAFTAGAAAWATQEPRVVRVSQNTEAAPSVQSRALGRSLVEALQQGQMTEARQLVEAGADVNYYLRGDGTPLVVAARFGSRDMVEYLVGRGADVNREAPGDGNPLIMAAAFGHMNVVEYLVAYGADVNGIVVDDETPLINAARNNRLDVARYLIARGADVNLAVDAVTLDGVERRSPLSEARRRGHNRMVELLRDNGATS